MTHPVITDNDQKQLYDLEHLGQASYSQTEAYLKYKAGVEAFMKERERIFNFSNFSSAEIEKKRRFSCRRALIFFTVYFVLAVGGLELSQKFPSIFMWIFPSIALGFTVSAFGLNWGKKLSDYFFGG